MIRTEDRGRQQRVVTCGNSKERGHNRQSCHNPPLQTWRCSRSDLVNFAKAFFGKESFEGVLMFGVNVIGDAFFWKGMHELMWAPFLLVSIFGVNVIGDAAVWTMYRVYWSIFWKGMHELMWASFLVVINIWCQCDRRCSHLDNVQNLLKHFLEGSCMS